MPRLNRGSAVTIELLAGQRIDVSAGGIVTQEGGGLAYDFRAWPAVLGAFTTPVTLTISAVDSDVDFEVMQTQEYAAAVVVVDGAAEALPEAGRTGVIYLTTEGAFYWYEGNGKYLAFADGTPAIPANEEAPVIAGGEDVGDTLTVTSNGVWTNRPTLFAYQWSLDGSEIEGATGASLVIPEGSEGLDITCEVIASNVVGDSDPENSNAITVAGA
jgi:hypothetical protein